MHVTMLDPPRNVMFDDPSMMDVGATYTCSADANPPVSSYEWTLVSTGEVLSDTQTLTLTEALVNGQLNYIVMAKCIGFCYYTL